MANSIPFAGLDKLQMNEQARLFAEFSNRIMQNSEFNAKVGKVSEKCSIIYFDGKWLFGKIKCFFFISFKVAYFVLPS